MLVARIKIRLFKYNCWKNSTKGFNYESCGYEFTLQVSASLGSIYIRMKVDVGFL